MSATVTIVLPDDDFDGDTDSEIKRDISDALAEALDDSFIEYDSITVEL